jgi:N6-adenosine-specific RNA methylase IME4
MPIKFKKKGRKEKRMNEITIAQNNLPTTVDDLAKFALIGREKLVAVRAEIRAIDKVGLADEVRRQKLTEAQEIAEAVLDAETKLGELMAKVPTQQGKRTDIQPMDSGVHKSKQQIIEDAGFTVKQVQRFETLAAHPEIVEQAKAEARENDDIVSRSLVLNMVREQTKKQERKEAIQQQIGREKASNHIDIYSTDKKYRVIYADPPWSYNDKQDTAKLGGAEKYYPTMPIEDICAIPVPSEKNAVLFLWTTSPQLEDSFKVINAWGFKYKSSFIWDKVLHAMGHYNSVRHEFLLIATKGSCTPDVPKLFDSVVSIERTEHSRKPKEFREMIDTLYPNGNRLEMFAREAPEGWDVWGNMA